MVLPGAETPEGWHVAWSTFRAWPPADERGSWQALAMLYEKLQQDGGSVEVFRALPRSYQGRPQPPESIRLSAVARDVVRRGILDLAATDRVAGETAVEAIAVEQYAVQALIACPAGSLHQRVGRFKSRTGTLLSFEPAAGCGGAGTWSQGFWWARLRDRDTLKAAASFIQQVEAEVPCRDG